MSNQSPEDEISKDDSPELNPSVNAQNMEAEQIEDGPREESLGNPEEVMDEKEPEAEELIKPFLSSSNND